MKNFKCYFLAFILVLFYSCNEEFEEEVNLEPTNETELMKSNEIQYNNIVHELFNENFKVFNGNENISSKDLISQIIESNSNNYTASKINPLGILLGGPTIEGVPKVHGPFIYFYHF